jgi:hypothetical protein
MTDVIDPVEVMAMVLAYQRTNDTGMDLQHDGSREDYWAKSTEQTRELMRLRAASILTAAEAAGMVWVKREAVSRASASIAEMVDEYTGRCWNDEGRANFALIVEQRLKRFLSARPSLTGPEQATREGDATPPLTDPNQARDGEDTQP